jgi:hypothetical protein
MTKGDYFKLRNNGYLTSDIMSNNLTADMLKVNINSKNRKERIQGQRTMDLAPSMYKSPNRNSATGQMQSS